MKLRTLLTRVAEIIGITTGVMAWWLVDHAPTKWFFGGVTASAVVFAVAMELVMRRPQPSASRPPLSGRRRLDQVYSEIMTEDLREVLKQQREKMVRWSALVDKTSPN